MKMVKKLSLLMAALMIVLSFATCSSEENKAGNNDEDAVKEVISEFADTINDGDLDKLEDFLADGSKAMKEMDMDLDELEKMADEIGVSTDILSPLFESMECEIKEVKIDGDKATCEVELSTLDDQAVSGDAINKYIEENIDLSDFSSQEEFKEWFLDNLDSIIEDLAKDGDTKTEDKTIKLEKIDNEWLITKAK